MQVDWISAFCESRGFEKAGYRPYDTGHVLLVGPGGTVERQSSRATTVEGSYDSRLLVQSRTGTDLYLSGNPVKFIQGHNLYGPSDPVGLFFDYGWEVRKALGLFPSAQTWDANEFEGPRFTRIDLTRSFRFSSAGAARSWLREVGATARSRHGGAVNTDGTIYLGKTSTRWALKVYHKLDEIHARRKGHRIPDELPNRERLVGWAEGVVRFELTLRRPELESVDFSRFDALALWKEYFGRVTWNRNARLVEADMFERELPNELRKTLALWRAGMDLRHDLLPDRTFYRHRRALLTELGVDIASPPPEVPAGTEIQPLTEDQAGWDPEPLEGYSWESEKQSRLL
jgi:II/X family phage/plasmid replication protein